MWHNLGGLKRSVAEELKIGPELFGPKRRNDDFNRRLLDELNKLRKKGLVSTWWSGRDWKHAFRLTDFEAHKEVRIPPLILDVPSPRYVGPSLVSFGEEVEMKRVFRIIMVDGDKDNTYKFVLAKVILDYCKDNASHDIRYDYLAHEFLKHYWYQEYRYGLKQDFKTEKRLRVISVLHDVFGGKEPPADFEHLGKDDVLAAKKKILAELFGHARNKKSLVVPRFQNIPGDGGDTVEYGIFYRYDDDAKTIYLRPEAHDFFKRNYHVLHMALIAAWARFLERVNGPIPYLVSKIEEPDKERGPTDKYRKLLSKYETCCFYCQTALEKNYTHVDHFLPWSYVFEDELWNLVLACRSCNLKKSNRVAPKELKERLVGRNRECYDIIRELRSSLEKLDRNGCGWEPEINRHYEMCLANVPGRISLP